MDPRPQDSPQVRDRRRAKRDVIPLCVLWLIGWIPLLHRGHGFAWESQATLGMVVLGITSWILADHYEHYREHARRVSNERSEHRKRET